MNLAQLRQQLCPDAQIRHTVMTALDEDLQGTDPNHDPSAALVSPTQRACARLICNDAGILCGSAWFEAVFHTLDDSTQCFWRNHDGDTLIAGQEICRLTALARALLVGERSALNLLQTLSATATQTHKISHQISAVKVLDTRKTIPGLRYAQKYAVRCGGGSNHRLGLFDALLLKENHLALIGSIARAVQQARTHYPHLPLEVEVENLQQLEEALHAGVDRILLDNFDDTLIHQAVTLNAGRAELEVSGNITAPERIQALAKWGVACVSCGGLTKHIHAVDFSLRMEPLPLATS